MKLTPEIIEGFVGSLLAPGFDAATRTPNFHRELWTYACSPAQYVAIAAPRGHAKSTAGTIAYGLAEMLFRSSRYLVIISDTETQATMFVEAIKQELATNKDLIDLFGLKKNKRGEVDFIKDTASDIIVAFEDDNTKFRIVAKGAQGSLRGILWDGMRPDLFIIDDLENDELVMNPDRRDKLQRWVYGALLPMLSPTGKVRMWGTILHVDSILNRQMPYSNTHGRKFVRETPLKIWTEWPDGKNRGWLSVLYRAHDRNFENILWPERFPKEAWIKKREQYTDAGNLDLYAQEFLNNPIDESIAYFKRSDILPRQDSDKEKRLQFYMTVDPAISEHNRADYSVFLIAGVDSDRIIHIVNVIRERMDGKEIVDCILTLDKIYDFEIVGIEEMLISQSLGPFLREEMIKGNQFPTVLPLKHKGKDKIQRARAIQARMRAKTVKFDKNQDWFPALEEELLRFPRGKHDDQVDVLAYLGMMLDNVSEAMTPQEEEEETYHNELRAGGSLDGRSSITGY